VEDVLAWAALSANEENEEPIDSCILESVSRNVVEELASEYDLVHYTPFDPVSKRTIARLVRKKDGVIVLAAKGAPQVILGMEADNSAISAQIKAKIDELAGRGYRSLGIGRAILKEGQDPTKDAEWEMVGLLPLFDPPRHDTAETIQHALDMGIAVKMITGDQLASKYCKRWHFFQHKFQDGLGFLVLQSQKRRLVSWECPRTSIPRKYSPSTRLDWVMILTSFAKK
jgi:H+-transporting ATPase